MRFTNTVGFFFSSYLYRFYSSSCDGYSLASGAFCAIQPPANLQNALTLNTPNSLDSHYKKSSRSADVHRSRRRCIPLTFGSSMKYGCVQRLGVIRLILFHKTWPTRVAEESTLEAIENVLYPSIRKLDALRLGANGLICHGWEVN